MSYLRIAGAVGAALALAFLWWRVSLSFSQGETIDAQAAQISTLEAARARDTRIAGEIAAWRADQVGERQAFLAEVGKKKISIEVGRYVDKVTGEEKPCYQRDPVRYRELYNRAVSGAAGVP